MQPIESTARARGGQPLLSVLVPFYRTSPLDLFDAICRQAPTADGDIEILLGDDGSGDPGLAAAVEARVRAAGLAAALVLSDVNLGRSAIRNLLARESRGAFLLFVDSDMRPAAETYLRDYVALCRQGVVSIVYGGFVMSRDIGGRDALHAYFSSHSDCLTAAERSRDPARHAFTNNLLVRRDVLASFPFDEGFRGWGWEDVEWALRVSVRWPIAHVDNPVVNPATGSAATLIEKFGGSAANFARLMRLHPGAVAAFPLYRASRLFARIPFGGIWAGALRRIVLTGIAPIPLRYLALKLYRACMYRTCHASAGPPDLSHAP